MRTAFDSATLLGDVGRCARVEVFFFFQAEDGIRDVAVTGVQTCALPISRHISAWTQKKENMRMAQATHYDAIVIGSSRGGRLLPTALAKAGRKVALIERSEERRVGKECRSRWSPYH